MNLHAIRITEGQDVKTEIEALVKKEHLSSATVISAVGSLSKVCLRMAGAKPNKQDIREYKGSFEIVSLIGNLGPGRVHLHMAVSNKEGAVIGGHLKEGNLAHTTVEVVLAADQALEFTEEIDPATGFGELHIIRHD